MPTLRPQSIPMVLLAAGLTKKEYRMRLNLHDDCSCAFPLNIKFNCGTQMYAFYKAIKWLFPSLVAGVTMKFKGKDLAVSKYLAEGDTQISGKAQCAGHGNFRSVLRQRLEVMILPLPALAKGCQ